MKYTAVQCRLPYLYLIYCTFVQILRTKYGVYEVAPESSSITALMASVIHYAAVNQREQHRLLADADKIAKVREQDRSLQFQSCVPNSGIASWYQR